MSPVTIDGREVGAVVFDLDGTLIHTTVDFRRMRERLFEELVRRGVPEALVDPAGTIVSNVERAVAHLRSQGREGEEEGLRSSVGRVMDRTEMERVGETTPVDGATACLDAIEARGLKVGVLTRGSRPYALEALRVAGLSGRFDAMVCRDDHPEEEAKPNGKAMERVAALLAVPPERCLVVGDHLMDMACARSVSAGFVGVLTGSFRRRDWSSSGDPPVIDSVADLPAYLGIGNG